MDRLLDDSYEGLSLTHFAYFIGDNVVGFSVIGDFEAVVGIDDQK